MIYICQYSPCYIIKLLGTGHIRIMGQCTTKVCTNSAVMVRMCMSECGKDTLVLPLKGFSLRALNHPTN